MPRRITADVYRGLALAVAGAMAAFSSFAPTSAAAGPKVGTTGPDLAALHSPAAASLPYLSQGQLERAAGRTLVFGHQSVGKNILSGVEALYRNGGLAAPSIVAWKAQAPASGGWIAEARVGKNTDPVSKIQEFESRLNSMAASPELALLKLCYVDVTSKTDVAGLFKKYRRAMARLKSAHPNTVILHATVPLKSGDKASNVKRQQYNNRIRSTYRRSGIVDIARAESTTPSGTRVTGKLNGQRYYAMHPGYTTDGGHLNNEGSQRVAAELIRVIAAN